MKKNLKITLSILLLLVMGLYLGIVFLLPQVVNSKITINKLQSFLLEKAGMETTIEGLNLKISPTFAVVLNLESLNVKNNKVSAVDIKKLSIKYKLLQKSLTLVSADNIYIDGNCLKGLNKRSKHKSRGKLELNNIPEMHIQKIALKSDKVNIFGENINTQKDVIELKLAINSPLLKETLKIGNSGFLSVSGNKLKANKFEITLGNSHLFLDGILIDENQKPNFDIKGEKLPSSEIIPIHLK